MIGWIMALRNRLFDSGLITQHKLRDRVVAIGNLSVGGTGKTPHTLFIGTILSKKAAVAVLSRGYGRKSSGFRRVDPQDSAEAVGDEPLMIKRRKPEWTVAVCESRVEGAHKLGALQKPEVLLLDDAFQHRQIDRDLNILLTRFDAPFTEDRPMPMGRLREPQKGAQRADICIVTHCTEDCTKEARGELKKRIAYFTKAPVFFSRMRSNGLENANGQVKVKGGKALLLAGIAKPASFSKHMKGLYPEIEFEDLFFSDHHRFSKKDIRSIIEAAKRNGSRIITTEKDHARLPKELFEHPSLAICYESIEVELLEEQALFEKILNDKLRFSQAV